MITRSGRRTATARDRPRAQRPSSGEEEGEQAKRASHAGEAMRRVLGSLLLTVVVLLAMPGPRADAQASGASPAPAATETDDGDGRPWGRLAIFIPVSARARRRYRLRAPLRPRPRLALVLATLRDLAGRCASRIARPMRFPDVSDRFELRITPEPSRRRPRRDPGRRPADAPPRSRPRTPVRLAVAGWIEPARRASPTSRAGCRTIRAMGALDTMPRGGRDFPGLNGRGDAK